MTVNTTLLADFLKAARTAAGLTQDQLHDRGATYRQLQGRIEGAEPIELEDGLLAAYDLAYRWPRGYAAAVAKVGSYATGMDVPAQNLLDNQLHPGDADPSGLQGRSTSGNLLSLLGAARIDHNYNHAAIGFHPATGLAAWTGYGILTNVEFAALLPAIDTRTGTTLLDTQLLDAPTAQVLLGDQQRGPRPRSFYRLGPAENALAPYGRDITPIALDALTDLTTLWEARRMVTALLELRPDVDTTVEHAAFTFLAIAAFGQDPFTTIRRIQDAAYTGQQHPDAPAFNEFWERFRERHDGSARLAAPDLAALQLIDPLDRSRESAKSIDLGASPEPGARWIRHGRSELPATTQMETIVYRTPDTDSIVFYDGNIAAHVPVLFKNMSPTSSLAIYRMDAPPGLLRVSNPNMGYQSIGVAAQAGDLDLVAHHQTDRIDTLTNHFGQYAVFCESGSAAVVWIPPS